MERLVGIGGGGRVMGPVDTTVWDVSCQPVSAHGFGATSLRARAAGAAAAHSSAPSSGSCWSGAP